MNAARLAALLTANGLRVKLWRERRVYVFGYGRDISCAIEPVSGEASLDQARIVVSSTWRSPHVGLRCKGVKHALLCDLHALGLLDVAPPDDWRRVSLDDRPTRLRQLAETPSEQDGHC